MNPQKIFFNQFGRLRSGWRFTIFLISYIFFASSLTAGFVALLNNLPVGAGQNSLITLGGTFAIFSVCAILLGWFYGKIFEDLPFRALGIWLTKNWLKNLILGLIVGAVSIGFAALIPFISGAISFQSNLNAGSSPIILTLSVTLFLFIAGAISEETLFRGYLLQTMSRAKLFFVGTLLTSALFASVHLGNHGRKSSFDFQYISRRYLVLHRLLENARSVVSHRNSSRVELGAGFDFGNKCQRLGRSRNCASDAFAGFRSGLVDGRRLRSRRRNFLHDCACFIEFAIWFLPFPKPSEEMLEMTGEEKLKTEI